jgi:hypothetical protein
MQTVLHAIWKVQGIPGLFCGKEYTVTFLYLPNTGLKHRLIMAGSNSTLM